MTNYTNDLTAEQLIRFIATDYVELSYEKTAWQRDEYIKICRDWLEFQRVSETKIYRFYWDCGRMGDVESLFTATESEIENIIGKTIYFGEILGKHSEISGVVEKGDINLISEDPAIVQWFKTHILVVGHSPLDYFEDENDE